MKNNYDERKDIAIILITIALVGMVTLFFYENTHNMRYDEIEFNIHKDGSAIPTIDIVIKKAPYRTKERLDRFAKILVKLAKWANFDPDQCQVIRVLLKTGTDPHKWVKENGKILDNSFKKIADD